jgi:hypothetical protein
MMTSYKNFTAAMLAIHNLKLKANETRNGYALRADGSLAGFSAKKTGTEGDRVSKQYFTEDGKFISIIRGKTPAKSWEPTYKTKQPVNILIGGQFVETKTEMKRVKNAKGPGYFHQPVTTSKVLPGVKNAGEFVLASVTKLSAD